MGAAIRAMDEAVHDPSLSVVSVHAQFLNAIPCGDITTDTEVLRAGRSVQQLASTLRSTDSDEIAIRLQGTWGNHVPDDPLTGLGIEMPDVPGAHDDSLVVNVDDSPFASYPINGNFEERHCPSYVRPGAFFDDNQQAESAVWTRLVAGCHEADGRFEPATLALFADRAPGPHLGHTFYGVDGAVGARPAVTLELSLRVVDTPVSEWLLVHSKVVEAGGRYMTTHTEIWDEDHRLIATSGQRARLTANVVPS